MGYSKLYQYIYKLVDVITTSGDTLMQTVPHLTTAVQECRW